MITTKNRKTHCGKTYEEWVTKVKAYFEDQEKGLYLLEYDFFQLLRDYFHMKAHIPEVKSEKTYRVGDKFLIEGTVTYLLAQVGVKLVSLVDVESGNRWDDPPVEVKNTTKITEEEFKIVIGGGDVDEWFLLGYNG